MTATWTDGSISLHRRNLRIVAVASLALTLSFSAWADVHRQGGRSRRRRQHYGAARLGAGEGAAGGHRLAEKTQPFGNRSRQALDALVHGKEVLVVERGKNRYQRVLGRVYRGGLDVNAMPPCSRSKPKPRCSSGVYGEILIRSRRGSGGRIGAEIEWRGQYL